MKKTITCIIAIIFAFLLAMMPIYADETTTAGESASTTETTASSTETTASTTETTASTTETTASTTETTASSTETTASTTEMTASTTETTASTTETTASTTETTASTTETTASMTETATSTTAIIQNGDEAGKNDSGNHTLFSRLWEFIKSRSTQILTATGSAVLLVINLIIKSSYKKSDDATRSSLSDIGAKVSETFGGQTSVIGAVNNLVDGYNGLKANYDMMKKSYDTYGDAEEERNRVVGAVFATNAAILEILTTVYVNSKNLPQGVKDLVNLKYAGCLKTLENDAQLKAIVDAVHKNIGAGYTEESAKKPEHTEDQA